jgi:hypothetical protein
MKEKKGQAEAVPPQVSSTSHVLLGVFRYSRLSQSGPLVILKQVFCTKSEIEGTWEKVWMLVSVCSIRNLYYSGHVKMYQSKWSD